VTEKIGTEEIQFEIYFLSSPEPMAQVSYCHRNLSGVRPDVCYLFPLNHFFSRTTWPISTKLGGKHAREWGFRFVQIKGLAPFGAQ